MARVSSGSQVQAWMDQAYEYWLSVSVDSSGMQQYRPPLRSLGLEAAAAQGNPLPSAKLPTGWREFCEARKFDRLDQLTALAVTVMAFAADVGEVLAPGEPLKLDIDRLRLLSTTAALMRPSAQQGPDRDPVEDGAKLDVAAHVLDRVEQGLDARWTWLRPRLRRRIGLMRADLGQFRARLADHQKPSTDVAA